nr:MAG TPA: neurotrophic factor [Bacteriophage sp.]
MELILLQRKFEDIQILKDLKQFLIWLSKDF